MSVLTKTKLKWSAIVLLAISILFSSAQKPPAREYQVKAAFLFNFSQFTEWPASAFSSPKAPLVIGILGEDPFGNYLDELVKEEMINGRPLSIQRFQDTQEIKNCHILFIKVLKPIRQQDIINDLKGKNILTVGEDPDFIKDGGMVRFVTINNKIQFQINPEATKKENITISSKLLRLAEIVTLKKSN